MPRFELLTGIDAIVFTGGVGEHQPVICAQIVERLRWMNVNHVTRVMTCNEEAVMAAAACRVN